MGSKEIKELRNDFKTIDLQSLDLSTTRLDLKSSSVNYIPVQISLFTALKWLNLPNNGIMEIPDYIASVGTLVSLRLTRNELVVISDGIGALTLMKNFSVGHNHIVSLPESIGDCVALVELECDNNQLEILPERLGELTNLRIINASSNHLKTLPIWNNLLSIDNFDLSYNFFVDLPQSLSLLTNLKILNMIGNRLEKVNGKVLSQLSNLKTLDLRINSIRKLPKEIGTLTALRHLRIRSNEVHELPEEIGDLESLEEFEAGQNYLVSLPTSIGRLTNLKLLHIYDNHLTSLPEEIGNMVELRELYAPNNELESLPSSLGNLEKLELIYLNNNRITHIDHGVFAGLVNVGEIYLTNNLLEELPDSVGQMEKLRKMNLCKNQITSLPSLSALSYLSNLDVGWNKIEVFPESLLNAVQLTSLNLFANFLQEIPEEVSNLVNLQVLILGYNELTTIPNSLSSLVSLTQLNLEGNKIEQIPPSIFKMLNLKYLALSNNSIREVPGDIIDLIELQHILFDCNEITSIPDSFDPMVHLEEINFAHNALGRFPDVILENLVDLDISGNDIYRFPNVSGCPRLNQMKISYNRIQVFNNDGKLPWLSFSGNPDIQDYYLKMVSYEKYLSSHSKKKVKVLDESSDDDTFEYRQSMGWAELCGRRPTMEDTIVIVPSFGSPANTLICCFDGHSGEKSSQLAAHILPGIIADRFKKGKKKKDKEQQVMINEDEYIDILVTTFAEVHNQITNLGYDDGTAATTVIVEHDNNRLIAANAGDQRVVLCRDGRAIQVTNDHKPDDPNELVRIYHVGGFVSENKRVNGILALSRALGDCELQPHVTYEPEVFFVDLQETDEYIIVACDGLWDEVTNEQAVEIASQYNDPVRAATALRDYSYSLGSTDNISVLVYRLKPISKSRKAKK